MDTKPQQDRVTSTVLEFSDRLLSATDHQAVFDATVSFFESNGANAVNLGQFDAATGEVLGVSSSMDSVWLDHYVAEKLFENDPLIDHFSISNAPLKMALGLELVSPTACDKYTGTMEGCLDAGYSNMIFVPVKSDVLGTSAAVTISHDLKGGDAKEFFQDRGGIVLLAATLASLRASQMFAFDTAGSSWRQFVKNVLSPREIEVLKWMAAGYRTDQIAYKLDIKPVTVHMHITSARKKTGSKTREQLVGAAILGSLI